MSILGRLGRRWLGISLVAATACSAAPATQAKAANPALWKVADHDTTIYLFGTFHALDRKSDWFNDEVKSAFDRSRKLIGRSASGKIASDGQLWTNVSAVPTFPKGRANRIG